MHTKTAIKEYVKSKFKYDKFVNIYITNGFNGTKAYLALNPNVEYYSAKTKASYLLTRKDIQDNILHKLSSDTELLELKEINKAIRAKLIDTDISYKDKLQYIRTSLELKGKLNNPNKSTQVNMGIVVNKDNK